MKRMAGYHVVPAILLCVLLCGILLVVIGQHVGSEVADEGGMFLYLGFAHIDVCTS